VLILEYRFPFESQFPLMSFLIPNLTFSMSLFVKNKVDTTETFSRYRM